MKNKPAGLGSRIGSTVRRIWRTVRREATRQYDGQAIQDAEFRAAQQRIVAEAERQRGTPEGGRHRWYDGPTRLVPLAQRPAPLLTYGQRCGYRCRG
ncbi:hypothetical protein [Micromonospora cathayae]|uniref:Uncharacterized protein n=1 Tax=Micromonospora cathayae TaxID=3028804 RepID=A0ABY7ZNK9_9ACTN|nr:hypothetical protein [Micromonospora sp. HUAS 3]WDZ84574.1 hypothetical protein PVK37_29770 [Micromonospora sp. HUAS 3]